MNTASRRVRSAVFRACRVAGLVACALGTRSPAVGAPAALGAEDATPRVLIGRDLSDEVRLVVGWDAESIVVLDEAGTARRRARAGVIALVSPSAGTARSWPEPDPDTLAGGTAVVIELTDGPWDSTEIEAAAEAAASALGDGEAVGVLPLSGGPLPVSLERIGRIVLDPWARGAARPGAWTPGVEDELILVNGDSVRGFLVDIEDGVVFDAGGGERAFPVERVAEIRLGNPSSAYSGTRLWLASGEIRNGAGDAGDGLVPASEVLAAWLESVERTPLAEAELVSFEAGGGRRWAATPRSGSVWATPLGVPDIAFDGPVRAAWDVPAHAGAFSAVARLGGSLDEPSGRPGPWADAEIAVLLETDGATATLLSVPLTRLAPEAVIACDLPGSGVRRLILEIREGRHGPIQDRVLLQRPVLLGR
jgi:hypothetical protein